MMFDPTQIDDESGDLPKAEPAPLSYWHTEDPSRPALWIIAMIGGFISAIIAMGLSGGVCAGVMLVGSNQNQKEAHWPLKVVAATWFGLAAAFVFGFMRFQRQGRGLPLYLLRRPGRYFAFGFLIGCWLVGLIEGICFSAAALSN